MEPALVSVCYRPRTAELMVPQAFRPLSWHELPDDNRAWLSVLGCDGSTWEDGEYFPARLKPLQQVRPCSLPPPPPFSPCFEAHPDCSDFSS